MPEAREQVPLPPGLDLLWGRRERGKRGPRAGLSADAIVAAAIKIADAKGLEAVSMERVARELGAEHLVIEGDDWRSRLRTWAIIQRDMLDRHPWITQMPMAAPPVAPNSLHFVERGLATLDDTGLADADKLRIIGLLASYTLSEARMASDAARAAAAAEAAGDGHGLSGPPAPFESLLRELLDEQTYPRLYRIAWTPAAATVSERDEFLFGIDRILDGVAALIERMREGGSG